MVLAAGTAPSPVAVPLAVVLALALAVVLSDHSLRRARQEGLRAPPASAA